ncbi:MAG TPA: regulatory signaling modulator protein AmpE [Steroidobacteraceae bacterium]|nr:regulatory signaling modulator protein AmpE [Steroidobacteraceae bacterium]
MNLLALLLGLGLERLLTALLHLREPRWFDGYFDWGLRRLGNEDGWPSVIETLLFSLLPVVPVALIAAFFSDRLFGVPYLLFATLVLIFSLGPRDLAMEVEDYCAALERGDAEEAARRATALLEDDASGRPGPVREALEEAVLAQSNNRIFGVIFWFMLLGPSGAWLFRVSDLLRRRAVFESHRRGLSEADAHAYIRTSQWMHRVLAWFPARITALFFPLAGSFDDAVSGWRDYAAKASEQFFDASDQVLVYVGRGALRLAVPSEAVSDVAAIKAALRLVQRTLVIWLVLLAALTLIGWLP